MSLDGVIRSCIVAGTLGLGVMGMYQTAEAQDAQTPMKNDTPSMSNKNSEKYSLKWYEQNFSEINSLELELRQYPTALGYCRLSAIMFESDKSPDEIEKVIEKSLEIDSKCSVAYSQKAWIYIRRAMTEKVNTKKDQYIALAEKVVTEALAFNGDTYLANDTMGAIYAIKNEHEKAIEWYTRAITIDSTRWEAYNNLARSLFSLGKKQEALSAFKAAYNRDISSLKTKKSVENWISYLSK